MTQALYLRKLADYVKGATSLTQGPIWLLGHCYGGEKLDTEAQDALLQDFLRDFRSRIWCTYRREFPPLGVSGLMTDIGWGCTLRSSQMLLAEALLRHRMGRHWRRSTGEGGPPVGSDVMELLGLLADAAEQPLSIHSICAAGDAYGVVPGKWLGPWVLCKTLEALLAQADVAARVGLRVHVVGDPGGGAPIVDGHRINKLLLSPLPPASDDEQPAMEAAAGAGETGRDAPATAAGGSGGGGVTEPGAASACAPTCVDGSGGVVTSATPDVTSTGTPGGASNTAGDAAGATDVAAAGTSGSAGGSGAAEAAVAVSGQRVVGEVQGSDVAVAHDSTAAESSGAAKHVALGPGLLLVVPLTLGVDKVSPLYHPQLQAVLSFPQSVGIVGGRPGASLYFVGCQDGQLLYLDPHEAQAAGPLAATAASYFCEVPRLMPLAALDPSLAIGFYCASQDDFGDLCLRLAALAQANRGAPLMTVATEQMREAVYMHGGDQLGDEDSGGAFDEDEGGGGEGGEGPSPLRSAAGGSASVSRESSGAHRRTSQQHEDWEVI